MPATVTALQKRQERAQVVADARKINDRALGENRDLTAEEQGQWVRLMGGNDPQGKRVKGRADELREEIDRLERSERLEGLEGDLTRIVPPGSSGDGGGLNDPPPIPGPMSRRGKRTRRLDRERRRATHRSAFRAWCLSGTQRSRPAWVDAARQEKIDLTGTELDFVLPSRIDRRLLRREQSEQRAGTTPTLSSIVGTLGGYIVPEMMAQSLEIALKAYWDLDSVTHIKSTGVGPWHWPTVNDTTTKGHRIQDGVQVSATKLSFGTMTLESYLYTSDVILVPIMLLADPAVPLDSIIGRLLGIRTGRILADEMTTGTGNAMPNGIVSSASNGATAALSNAISADDLYVLEHSCDPAYRPGAKFMFHDQVLLSIKRLKSGIGTYLWQPGLASGAPDQIDGYGYVINQSMASTITSGAKSILFGSLTHFMVREMQNQWKLVRLVERYMDQGCIGFIAYSAWDGDMLDAGTHPVVYLVH